MKDICRYSLSFQLKMFCLCTGLEICHRCSFLLNSAARHFSFFKLMTCEIYFFRYKCTSTCSVLSALDKCGLVDRVTADFKKTLMRCVQAWIFQMVGNSLFYFLWELCYLNFISYIKTTGIKITALNYRIILPALK